MKYTIYETPEALKAEGVFCLSKDKEGYLKEVKTAQNITHVRCWMDILMASSYINLVQRIYIQSEKMEGLLWRIYLTFIVNTT